MFSKKCLFYGTTAKKCEFFTDCVFGMLYKIPKNNILSVFIVFYQVRWVNSIGQETKVCLFRVIRLCCKIFKSLVCLLLSLLSFYQSIPWLKCWLETAYQTIVSKDNFFCTIDKSRYFWVFLVHFGIDLRLTFLSCTQSCNYIIIVWFFFSLNYNFA